MKFNPYAVLLTTGVLMLATVVFAQTRTSVALLKAGATSVDRDVSSFAARKLSSLGSRTDEKAVPATRVASIEGGGDASKEW
jgi:hypothetical protein